MIDVKWVRLFFGVWLAVLAYWSGTSVSAQEAADVALPRPSIYDSRWFPSEDADAGDYQSSSPDRRFIYIHQDLQTMFLFEDGEVTRTVPCSTGLPTVRTYTKPWLGRVGVYWGTFFAFDVYADEAWYLFRDDGSILIHSAPYTLDDGEKVYQEQELLGVAPASHGCIRIPPEDASWLTAWGPKDVLTLITPLTAWPIER